MDLTLASLCHANFAAGGFGRGEGEVGMGDLSPPPILLYTTIWLNILIYTILLSRFDLTGRDLWFIYNEILEFHNWIVCYHEHFQHKLRRWKSLELKMDLWHLTDMKVILTLKYWTLLKVVLLLLVLILLHLMKSNGYVHLLNILHKNL